LLARENRHARKCHDLSRLDNAGRPMIPPFEAEGRLGVLQKNTRLDTPLSDLEADEAPLTSP